MTPAETEAAWVALGLVRGVGSVTLRALLATFGTLEGVLAAPDAELRKVRGVGPKIAAAIRTLPVKDTQQAIARWRAAGVSLHRLPDATYPPRLAAIPDAPATLFAQGELRSAAAPHVAIVGTRSPSPLAARAAATAARTLARQGAVIVSGAALGVDAIALNAALEVPNSYAIGVLGSGVLRPYPPENAALMQLLRLYGLLLCEVAPDATVSAAGLVARNRVITGLADAILIVETDDGGGAMHAARAAIRQGRRLAALDVPASGNRALIDSGDALPLPPDLHDISSLVDGL